VNARDHQLLVWSAHESNTFGQVSGLLDSRVLRAKIPANSRLQVAGAGAGTGFLAENPAENLPLPAYSRILSVAVPAHSRIGNPLQRAVSPVQAKMTGHKGHHK
jgi:hypothetical protein